VHTKDSHAGECGNFRKARNSGFILVLWSKRA
jgi:hypothetical protein